MSHDAAPANAPAADLAGGALRLLAYPLFFTSGAAGLIYEVLWTRKLLAVFGAGLYAVCAVLAAFMAGLALGSWLLGRVSDRLHRPLRLYGGIELLIALCGVLIFPAFQLVSLLDQGAYKLWEDAVLAADGDIALRLAVIRFVFTFLVMLVPTTLMGATLPVLSRFLIRQREHLGLHVGGLYSINTLGAVAGAFAAGFFLIATFGLTATAGIAVGLNVLAGVGALLMSLAIERGTPPPEPEGGLAPGVEAKAHEQAAHIPPELAGIVRWVLFTAFVSGLVALAAQVMWTRSLVFVLQYLKNTTYAFSAMLTVFLAGLGLGSAIIGPLVDHQRHPLRLYGILLTLIGMSMAFSITVLSRGATGLLLMDPLGEDMATLDWKVAVVNVMLQTFSVLGIPTLLMGMAFPVAARVVVQMGRVGRDVGRLYAANTFGAIVGSVLAGFVLVPLLGLTRGLLLLAVIDIVLGLITIARAASARTHLLTFGSISTVMVLFVFFTSTDAAVLHPLESDLHEMIYYEEGPLATVSVVENNVDERTIYVDGVGVAGTDPILQTDQKSLAHVPMMLMTDAESVLTVGFGAGGASYSLLLHDRLDRVHCAEICKTVLNAAPALKAANHGFYGDHPLDFARRDDRYAIILDDVRAWLTHTTRRYDFIATDCTDLRYKSNANLYDLEYFEVCRERLTEDGIVVVWMPLAGLDPNVFRVALRTFYRVFPEMGIFFMCNEPTHYILMIGWQDRVELDYELFAATLREMDIREDLAEIYLDDPVKLLSCFITGGRVLGPFLEGDALNTEDHPIIEFESPKYGFGDRPLIDNLNALMEIRVSPREFLTTATMPPAELARLERYEQALPHIIEGLNAYREIRIEEATRSFLRARDIAPEDLSVRNNLLAYPILQQRIQNEPEEYVNYYLLGRARMVQALWEPSPRRIEEAYSLLERAQRHLEERLTRLQTAGVELTERSIQVVHLRLIRQWLTELDAEFRKLRR